MISSPAKMPKILWYWKALFQD